VNAQNSVYLSQGRIEFERKVHTHALMDENESWAESMKKVLPKFRTTYHTLFFHDQITLFTPGKPNPDNVSREMEMPGEENMVFSQLDKEECTSQKKIFGEIYLVKDSTRPVRWKITDETRNIAGFECRRANALIMDSVYVVAYYTDAIITPGGPESLHGLPGMILGLAIPHEHVTWFATKVYAEEINDGQLKAPAKGKLYSNKTLQEILSSTLKRWGSYGNRLIVTSML
jgi:GLPGLI family protein